MILSALFSILGTTLNFIVGFLPQSSGVPASVQVNMYNLIENALSWEYYFPVLTFFTAAFVVISAEIFLFTWQGLRYIISIIRGR